MTYELTQNQHAQDDEERKRKIVAFKSINEEEELANDEDNKEMTFITHKFKRFMEKNRKVVNKMKEKKSLAKNQQLYAMSARNWGIKSRMSVAQEERKEEKMEKSNGSYDME